MRNIDLFLHISKKSNNKLIILNNINNFKNYSKNFSFLYLNNYKIKKINNKKIFITGDLINENKIEDIEEKNLPQFLQTRKGHFYLIIYDEKKFTFYLISALFNMLPLFYYENNSSIIVTNKIKLIENIFKLNHKINKKYIVEQFIFNYPLFDSTIFKDIKLCPTNHYIHIAKGKINFIKHTDITSFYVDNPVDYKRAAKKLAPLFINNVKEYLPNNKFYISFTGGFDGRTLVACAHFYRKDFVGFSFGTRKNDDVNIPLKQSEQLGIPFLPIFLDNENYVTREFLETGKELIDLTNGFSNFLYVHFLYSTKLLSGDSSVMLTGYFGSELFRALHLTGAMNSPELISFFRNKDKDRWINDIRNSSKISYMKREVIKNEIEQIIYELDEYKKNNLDRFTTLNQFFYKYVFEEIFRKVFGSHIFAQSYYTNIRTPFLDFEFIKELLKTELAGVNNEFFVQNPLKRWKGQLLYAKIINNTFPTLGEMITQKGYSPKDLLSSFGKLKIIFPFLEKRINRKIMKPYLDNLSIISGIKYHWPMFKSQITNSGFYNVYLLEELAENLDNLSEEKRDLVAISASSAMLYRR
ncbi:MAG: hypothetical protein Kow0068_12130 [Marinilabiliales bacterium]